MKIIIITKKIWNFNNLRNFKFKHKVYNRVTEKLIKNKKSKKNFFLFIGQNLYQKKFITNLNVYNFIVVTYQNLGAVHLFKIR